jgi:hypothetical protein
MNRVATLSKKKLIITIVFLPVIGWIGLYTYQHLVDMGFPFHMHPSFSSVLIFPEKIKGRSKAEVVEIIGKPDRDEGLAWVYLNHDFFNLTGQGALTVWFNRNTGTVDSLKYDSSGI